MNPKIYIGTSSFNNRFWQPDFYPADLPRSEWFHFYCSKFNTYEINVTFYKSPTVRTLQTWYRKSPPGFLYAVKAPKTITHIKRFAGAEDEINKFYDICSEGLTDKLGPILFQLPPSFKFSLENLKLIVNSLNPNFKNIIEFRDISWWRTDVFETLAQNNLTFCNVSYPNLPENINYTNQTGYIRMHGKPRLFYSGYAEIELKLMATDALSANVSELFIFFNNTAAKEGIENAVFLKEQIAHGVENP